MNKFLLIPAICVMAVSCNSKANDKTPESSSCSSGYAPADENQTSDWKITSTIKKNLMMDGSLSAHARMISVTTNNGVVTLTGTVASSAESHKIVKMVKSVSGVNSVDNQLKVAD